jgi:hypothetical protein
VRELSEREDQNILKLKLDEMIELESFPVEDMGEIVLSRVLNFFSSRSAFFIIFIKREGLTDPFLRLLDFFDKSVKVF